MKNFLRMTLLAATLAGTPFSMLATNVSSVPVPAQNSVVQHLKLTNDQVAQIRKLHQQSETDASQTSVKDIKDGALIDAIKFRK